MSDSTRRPWEIRGQALDMIEIIACESNELICRVPLSQRAAAKQIVEYHNDVWGYTVMPPSQAFREMREAVGDKLDGINVQEKINEIRSGCCRGEPNDE